MVCAVLALTGTSAAQAQELFKVLPSNQLQDATPVQNEAIQKLRQRPTTQSLDLVQVDVNALRGDTTQLAIPNSPLRTLSKRSADVTSPNNFTWHGTLTGVPGQATLVVHDGNITGSIQDDGTLYRIEPVGNGVHALIKVDQGRLPPEHPPSFQQKERRGDIQAPPGEPGCRERRWPCRDRRSRRLHHRGANRGFRYHGNGSARCGRSKPILCEQRHQH
jgi:hypothetical protein